MSGLTVSRREFFFSFGRDDMKVIHVLESIQYKTPSIFLAGPMHRDLKQSWRTRAIDVLAESFQGTVYTPEEGKYSDSWSYSKQVDWEMAVMSMVDTILPGLTTNIEFGEYMHSGKIVVGFPRDSDNNRYIAYRCEKLGIPLHDTLRKTIAAAISISHR
jgi:hypothetical protein